MTKLDESGTKPLGKLIARCTSSWQAPLLLHEKHRTGCRSCPLNPALPATGMHTIHPSGMQCGEEAATADGFLSCIAFPSLTSAYGRSS